jgi:hypothetical protein
MAYATVEDVNTILPDEEEDVPAESEDRLEVMLEEATDLVVGYLESERWPTTPETEDDEDGDGVHDEVPPAVRRVTARVAMRTFLDDPWNPGAESEVNLMGPFSHTINWSKEVQARDLYLTDMEKLRLDRFKLGYKGSAAHVPMYDCHATQ